MNNRSAHNKTQLARAQKLLKKVVKMAKRKWADQEVAKAEMLYKVGHAFQSFKAAYKLAKGFKAHHKIHNPMIMKQADGSYSQNNFQNTEFFKEHFKQLFNNIKKLIKQQSMKFWTTIFFGG